MEYGESFEQCAQRELLEEVGLQAGDFKHIATTNDVFRDEEKHYVTLFMMAKDCRGEARVCEPDKCEGWAWFDLDNLPEPLFLPLENFYSRIGRDIVK